MSDMKEEKKRKKRKIDGIMTSGKGAGRLGASPSLVCIPPQ